MAQISPPARTDWVLVALLFVAGLFAAAQFGKISLTLVQLEAIFALPLTTLALLVSVVGLVGLLGGVMAGALVAGLGPRRVLLACLWLGAALSLVQALLPPFPVLFGLRVIEGFSHLGLVVAAPPLMARAATDRDRPMVMSIWAMFFGVSFALSAMILPSLLGLGGVPLVFVAHGAGFAVLALLLAPRVARSIREPLELNPLTAHLRTYRSVRTAAPGLGFVFYTICYVALLTLLPTTLGQPALGIWLPLVSLLGNLGAGQLGHRVPPATMATAGFVLAVASALALLAGQEIAVWPMFFAMGVVPSASFGLIPVLNPDTDGQARATGAIAQLGNLGTVTGTPIFALALTWGGVPAMLWLVVGFSLTGIVVVQALSRLALRAAPV
jgi:MFS family permease